MIFNIKMGESFRQNAPFFAGGHMTDTLNTLTYASIVSRDSVRIVLTLVAINVLDTLSYDTQNAYLASEFQEKIWNCAGQEFGSEAGTIMIVEMALYGLNYSNAAFCAHLEETLNDNGFLSTKAYPDVWYPHAVKPNGFEYYEYILCYLDDILCMNWSIPRFHLRSHYIVCNKNHLFIVGIGSIISKEIGFIY